MSVEVFSEEADVWINRGKKELPSPDMNGGCSAGWGPGMPEPFTCPGHQNSLFIAFRIPELHQHHLNFSGVKKLGLSPVVSLVPCHMMGLLTLCNCNWLLYYLTCNKSACPMGFVSLENYISRLLLQNNLTYSECYTPFQMKANSIQFPIARRFLPMLHAKEENCLLPGMLHIKFFSVLWHHKDCSCFINKETLVQRY